MILTCHVNSKGPVSSPARVPTDDLAVLHDRALVAPAPHQPHGPHWHLARRPHLQEAGTVSLHAPSQLCPECCCKPTGITNTRNSKAILAYRLQPKSCMCPVISSSVNRHLNSTLNTLFIISVIPRDFRAVKKTGLFSCLGFQRHSRSFLSARLQHSGSGLMSMDCWDTVETQW